MKIGSMFQKNINREINGVIQVTDISDENQNQQKQELEEYVITRELQRHFGTFYDNYEYSYDHLTDRMGVWISGFFGCGKSHFMKILNYLLANTTVAGKKAIEYFADKFDYDPLRYEMMKKISKYPTETIMFNIDQKAGNKDKNVILRTFAKVFYEHCGFYGDDLKVASFERFLKRQGKLEEFKRVFEEIRGDSWINSRDDFPLLEVEIVEAVTRVTNIPEQTVSNWFNGVETGEMSIDRLSREIKEYVDSKEPNFHLIFLVDEIGQFIGDDGNLMLNLQTIVEDLGSACNGKVWVIVTSQEDIDSVTHVRGNDFSKIQGRFYTRLSLSASSADEVVKRRILAKNPEAESLLRLLYHQNASAMKNLFTFSSDAISDLKGYVSEEEFVASYPFVPYQFKLLQNIFVQIRKHGTSAQHISDGERTMLAACQKVAKALMDRDEKSFAPFYRFYDTFSETLDSTVRRSIERATVAAENGDGLKAQDIAILKLLFLIRYLDEIPSNIDNLATLMVEDINADKIIMKRNIQESLDRLVREGYVSRNGERYLFLTDEEQEIDREIRNMRIEESEIIHEIGQIIFADLYPNKRFRYKNRYDFQFDQMVDNAMIGQPQADIKLRLATVNYYLRESEADSQMIMQSKAGDEAIVLISSDYNYTDEIVMALKIQKYVRTKNLSQLPEAIRKIIQGRQSEAKEREKTASNLLKEAIVNGTFYVAGSRANIRSSNVKDALDQALTLLIEDVYSKLNYVSTVAQNDADIWAILSSTQVQESMLGVEGPDGRALQDMMQFMDIRKAQHMQVTASDFHKRYHAKPYGWQELDIAAMIAKLIKTNKAQAIYGGVVVPVNDRKLVDYLRKKTEIDKTIVRKKIDPPGELIQRAKDLASEFFGVMDLKSDSDGLCGQVQALLGDVRTRVNTVSNQYVGNIQYPGRAVVDKGLNLLHDILSKKDDQVAFLETFVGKKDELLDWIEDFQEVEFFFDNQAQIFRDSWRLCDRVNREKTYFANESDAVDAEKTMEEILQESKPYRRIQELPTLTQIINQAYKRINDTRLEKVEQTIVQCRGDIHTLTADYPSLKDRVRRDDEELEKRKNDALNATSPTQLDAMITQIYTFKDAECKYLEAEIAKIVYDEENKKIRIQTLRRYDVVPQKRLTNKDEVDAYVEEIRKTLMKALENNDVIQLN